MSGFIWFNGFFKSPTLVIVEDLVLVEPNCSSSNKFFTLNDTVAFKSYPYVLLYTHFVYQADKQNKSDHSNLSN